MSQYKDGYMYQGTPKQHFKINSKNLDADFFFFSSSGKCEGRSQCLIHFLNVNINTRINDIL